MEQRVHLITLGVSDLERAAAFYDALGWQRVEKAADELVVYNLLGSVLGLYPRERLARDVGVELPQGGGAMLSHNTRAPHEVDALIERAREAGADVVRSAHLTHWGGRAGYFRDPDGHLWEVAYNPYSPLGADGAFRWGGVDA